MRNFVICIRPCIRLLSFVVTLAALMHLVRHSMFMQKGVQSMAGINCQPYSVAGDKLRERDVRASSLPKALMFSHLIRAQVVVLECTPLAKLDEFVQQMIREFAFCNDMTIEQQVLKLGNCWASRRD